MTPFRQMKGVLFIVLTISAVSLIPLAELVSP